ncbi:MAG: 30S ribosomal protein S12 methylthiotransferase RimO [Bdellovibrionaceae bacterium]|nr:30S ribosomal protein S12 methylthiotransferase RimO [Pseudobdellovibrionaceae bacterium]
MKKDKKSVHFISLGCPKNLVDTEIMVGTLMKDGYEVVADEDGADTVIINTCGFIEDSKRESIQRILEMGELKKQGKIKKLVVAGCLTQRYKSDIVDELPEADLFVGSGEFQNIDKILDENKKGSEKRTFFNLPTYLQDSSTPRVNTQPKHRAYLKISEGCLKRCAFCAIPLIRGNLQSRSIENVVNEAKLLVAGGVKEIIIISHDFTDYGWDITRKNPEAKDSPYELLKALDQVEGLEWIRLLYLYPDGLDKQTLQLIKNSKKIVKYFDMPLQHINNEVLKKMNRKMTKEQISEVIRNIRTEMPEAVIRTQFIVGFPGETDEQFNELVEFVKEHEFDRVGCFSYSPEENTPAGKMVDQIEDAVKQQRHDLLMKTQQKISKKLQRRMIGKVLDVMVEGFSEETELLLQGRNSQQAPDIDGVTLINSGTADVGQIVKVRITDSLEYDLIGEIVE